MGLKTARVFPSLAAAIVAGAHERNLQLTEVRHFHSLTGKGVTGTVDGRVVALGNAALFEELDIDASDLLYGFLMRVVQRLVGGP